MRAVDTFAAIADERRELAGFAAGLTAEQQRVQSLCSAWTVHDVLAHLVMPLEVGIPRFALAMLVARGNFDRANVRLTSGVARRPFGELVEVLRQKAGSRFTPPGAGPEAPLTDLLVHGWDVRRPLGLPRTVPEERLRVALDHLATGGGAGIVPRGRLDGLRLEATDLDWAHGQGAPVRGTAEALLLSVSGRSAALEDLAGPGVPILRDRPA